MEPDIEHADISYQSGPVGDSFTIEFYVTATAVTCLQFYNSGNLNFWTSLCQLFHLLSVIWFKITFRNIASL